MINPTTLERIIEKAPDLSEIKKVEIPVKEYADQYKSKGYLIFSLKTKNQEKRNENYFIASFIAGHLYQRNPIILENNNHIVILKERFLNGIKKLAYEELKNNAHAMKYPCVPLEKLVKILKKELSVSSKDKPVIAYALYYLAEQNELMIREESRKYFVYKNEKEKA